MPYACMSEPACSIMCFCDTDRVAMFQYIQLNAL